MCGIVGVVRLDGVPLHEGMNIVLQNMAREMAYRGPDDEQIFFDGPLGFAFRRLAIIDLDGGRQPLQNEDGSLTLIVNGEIYNYKDLKHTLRNQHCFKTNSDSEIILHLYEEKGIRFLEDLIGMYAIALWDSREKKLILARDRFGIKPLFYTVNQERLVFGSEIKSLFRYPDCPRRFDWNAALTDSWMSGSVATDLSDPSSFFEGIDQLPAGCALEVNVKTGRTKMSKYWNLLDIPVDLSLEETDADTIAQRYVELLEDSVSRCMQSDVEVGLFLSGGIDSAAVASIAAKSHDLHTFTVLSQSTFTNEDAKYAHLTAKHLGIPNHQVLFRWDQNEFEPDDWKRLLWLCETPFCGPEQLYKFHLHRYARATRPNLKVILTGQGSDEFTGGYSSTLAPAWEPNWDGFSYTIEQMDYGRHIRTISPSLLVWNEHFQYSPLSREFLLSQSSEYGIDSAWLSYVATKYRDLQMYNNWHEDRIAAGNSIENRVPFLDHRLVELAMSIPSSKRREMFWDKRLVRAGLSKYLPEEIRWRKKVPFFYGKDARFTNRMMLELLFKQNRRLLEEAFSSEETRHYLNRDAMFSIANELSQDPEVMNMEFFLRLVNMGLLQQMAKSMDVRFENADNAIILLDYPIEDWEKDEQKIRLQLASSRSSINLEHIPRFAPEVSLMKRDDSFDKGEVYLVFNNRVEFVLTEEEASSWLRVLRQIDGEKSFNQILEETGVTESEIRKFLEEALDFGVLVIMEMDIIVS